MTYESAGRAWHASDRSDFATAFRRAQRHSRFVRMLRVGIPVFFAGGLALTTMGNWIIGQAGLNLPAIGALSISGSKITMDQPRMSGYTRDGRPYELNAKSADQDIKNPQIIEMNAVSTKVKLQDGSTVLISADAGVYDSKGETVVLRDNIVCIGSNGTEMRLSEATIDMKKGHIVSQKPVEVVQPQARITANGLEIVDDGAVVRFQGGVHFTSDGKPVAPGSKRVEAQR